MFFLLALTNIALGIVHNTYYTDWNSYIKTCLCHTSPVQCNSCVLKLMDFLFYRT